MLFLVPLRSPSWLAGYPSVCPQASFCVVRQGTRALSGNTLARLAVLTYKGLSQESWFIDLLSKAVMCGRGRLFLNSMCLFQSSLLLSVEHHNPPLCSPQKPMSYRCPLLLLALDLRPWASKVKGLSSLERFVFSRFASL